MFFGCTIGGEVNRETVKIWTLLNRELRFSSLDQAENVKLFEATAVQDHSTEIALVIRGVPGCNCMEQKRAAGEIEGFRLVKRREPQSVAALLRARNNLHAGVRRFVDVHQWLARDE